MRDYYAILGLPRTATPSEIEAAFRILAKRYHPDTQPEEEDATVQFKLATEAHEVLSDAEKRREYDRSQHRRRRMPVAEAPFPIRATVSKPTTRPPRESLDIETELRLRPEEAGQGRWIEMRVSIPEPCASCGGQGCPACRGEGTVVEPRLVRFQVPPGLNDGAVLGVEGHGKSAWKDGPRGDLYLVVRVRPCW